MLAILTTPTVCVGSCRQCAQGPARRDAPAASTNTQYQVGRPSGDVTRKKKTLLIMDLFQRETFACGIGYSLQMRIYRTWIYDHLCDGVVGEGGSRAHGSKKKTRQQTEGSMEGWMLLGLLARGFHGCSTLVPTEETSMDVQEPIRRVTAPMTTWSQIRQDVGIAESKLIYILSFATCCHLWVS